MIWDRMCKKNILVLATAVILVAYPVSAKSIPDSTVDVFGNGKPVFRLNFFDEGNSFDGQESTYTLNPEMKQAIAAGGQYWADILAPTSRNQQAVDIWVTTMDDANAYAYSSPKDSVQSMLQNGWAAGGASGVISIGKELGLFDPKNPEQYGWGLYPKTQLAQNGLQADLVGTTRHEMGHALGIAASVKSDGGYYVTDDEGHYYLSDKLNSFTSHLYDQNGNWARAGARIVSNPAEAKPGDFVVVPEHLFTDGNGMDYLFGGNLYFSGEHVAQVLSGALLGPYQVPGIPVNGWEINPEFSHFQMGGLMSHEPYTNYTTFTELELAAMQDMGYALDRRNFYGYSIYNNDLTHFVNENGYSARNDSGTGYLKDTYNNTAFGVGLHIYGGRNTVMQAADILTMGTAAIGIRVDGQQNHLTIPKGVKVYANGEQGTGVLVSAGRNQQIAHSGDIRAMGEGGIGARFDFGDGANGVVDEYRGSYIRHQYVNRYPITLELLDSLNGALVDSFDIAGTLAGKEAAIYIGANAFVKEINVLDGAYLVGDIVSKWKDEAMFALRPELTIQYDGADELVTDLNFSSSALVYDGDITGADNLRMNVTDGNLYYTGTANVLSADVKAGAVLRGNGSYLLDRGSGVFTNHGVLSPVIVGGQAGELTIKGDLVSDGRIGLATNLNTGSIIHVGGSASIDGTRVVRMEGSQYMPDTSHRFLSADLIEGAFVGGAFSGMLSVEAVNKQTYAEAALKRANNLGTMDSVQNVTYRAMDAMYDQTSRKMEMTGLYSLDAATAKTALTDIAGGVQADMAHIVQNSRLMDHAVAARLTQAKRVVETPVQIQANSFAGRDFTADVVIPLELDADHSWWFQMGKNWGEANDGNNRSHSSSLILGIDKATGENWRQGLFFAYGQNDFATVNANAENWDCRIGWYGGYHKDAKNIYLYADIGRQKNEATRYLRPLGLNARSDYDSQTLELGAEYKYDLQYGREKIWQVSPYLNVQAVRYTQDGYHETDAGIYNQWAQSMNDTYAAGEMGMEFARQFRQGGYALRVGYKRTFSGTDPDFRASYEGNLGNAITVKGSSRDKNHLVCGFSGKHELAAGWILDGDLQLEKGSGDRNLSAALKIQRVW